MDLYPMHLYVGSSSFAGWQLVQAQEAARARHFLGPASEQLDSQLRALDISLDDKALARLDEMSPRPGGAAPEAYAW
jgi:hypothetical protein